MKDFVDQIKVMGIKQVLSAPRSPWQRAYVERFIGTIRRECLDHVFVFGERSLYRHLQGFVDYYHRSRTHLGLEKNFSSSSPDPIGGHGTGCFHSRSRRTPPSVESLQKLAGPRSGRG